MARAGPKRLLPRPCCTCTSSRLGKRTLPSPSPRSLEFGRYTLYPEKDSGVHRHLEGDEWIYVLAGHGT